MNQTRLKARLAVVAPWLVLLLMAAFIVHDGLSPAVALVLGIVTGAVLGDHRPSGLSTWSSRLMKISIVALGFGLHIGQFASQAGTVLAMAMGTLALALAVGFLLRRFIKVPTRVSWLLACGSGICGGSAIAAVAPVLKAKDDEVATALSVVFLLNALALFVFPWAGQWMGMSQTQFGVWAGLAIHDTSSVVGAAAAYGDAALQVATPVKLTRALMIVPLTVVLSLALGKRQEDTKRRVAVPGFIVLFVVASLLGSYLPSAEWLWEQGVAVGRQLLVLALFVMGVGVRASVLGRGSGRSMLHGVLLWMVLSGVTLLVAFNVPWMTR